MKSRIFFIMTFSAIVMYAHNDSVESYLDQGHKAFEQKKASLAISCFRKAVNLDPNNFDALFQLGNIAFYLGKHEEACWFFTQCLSIDPHSYSVLKNMGITLSNIGKHEQAGKIFKSLHNRNPYDNQIRDKLLFTYLKNSDWQRALSLRNVDNYWWYNEDLNGKKVLVKLPYDNGNYLGDCFYFIRYVKRLYQAGAHTIVQAPKILIPLLSQCPYINQLIPSGAPLPTVDKTYSQCIVSLILLMKDSLQTDVGDLPYPRACKDVPYLYADPKLIDYWQHQLTHDTHFKVVPTRAHRDRRPNVQEQYQQ